MHSAARALHSNWLDIGTPCLRVDLILANLRQVPFSDYCPQGHCPNGQVGLTERSGAARADAESDYPDDDRNRGSSDSFDLNQDWPSRNTTKCIATVFYV
jgi:hypothetical protein